MKLHISIKRLFSVEHLLLLGFYFVFAFFYFLAIHWSTGESVGESYYKWQIVLDYSLKGAFTWLIWLLLFRMLKGWPLWRKLLLHLVLAPLFAKGWQQVYYLCCRALGLGHLWGSAEWWDIYIPTLFYVLEFGIFHAYDYYQRLQTAQLHQAELRETALQNELSALKAQLHPHFLYNAFNTINASVPPGHEATRELVASLADLFRYQVWASRQELVLFREELSFVRQYLKLEEARFGDRLRVHFDIDPLAEDCPVPPMLLQPLLENAVRHGIGPLVEGGDVKLSAHLAGDQLAIEISDTGTGIPPDKLENPNGTGVGLYNTRRRLALTYGVDLHISDVKPRGTRITFSIPNHPTYAKSSAH
ncbi:MAG: histidine kinase [Lewinellaceae bacterium]|nr:histidine kinase [Lewinella sp.]MCB9281252.1 histidine kinase [Lewinellaceae bacterium]